MNAGVLLVAVVLEYFLYCMAVYDSGYSNDNDHDQITDSYCLFDVCEMI